MGLLIVGLVVIAGLVGSLGLFFTTVRDGRTSNGLSSSQVKIIHNEVLRARGKHTRELSVPSQRVGD